MTRDRERRSATTAGVLGAAVAAVACAGAVGGFDARRRLRTRVPAGAVARDASGLIDVSVVIPARDEAASIGTLLDSLAAQRLRPCEVIVVDDGSTDGTADVARRPGVRVVPSGGPPPGWLGKPWACQVGAEAASGRLLWFLDADVRLAAEASASLLALHDEVGGLVSVQPYHDAAGGAEQLSAVFNAVAVLGSGELSPLGPPPAHRRAAFGPCLLVDRRTHLTLGGHGAVRDEIVEDMALARHHAAAGQPVTCRLGGDLVRFRMYPDGAQAMADGWTKNIAVGAGAAHPPAALLTAGWVAASAYVAAATTTSLVRPGRGPHRWAAAIGWLVVASTLHAVLRPIGAFRPWVAALFPLPFAWFVGVFARASVLTARGAPVRWKGRAIPAGRRATTSRREGPCCR